MKRADRNSVVGNATINDFSFDKLKRDKVNFEERLGLIHELLQDKTYFEEMFEISMDKYDVKKGFLQEDYEYATRLEALATYLLFAEDIKITKKQMDEDRNYIEGKYTYYYHDKECDKKHNETTSLEGEIEIANDGEDIKVEPARKNYKYEKKRTMDNTDLKEMMDRYPFIKDYLNLLDYLKENKNNPEVKAKPILVKEDILDICDKSTIRFKMPLGDGTPKVDLDEIHYDNRELIRLYLVSEYKDYYDYNSTLDIILSDYDDIFKKIKFKKDELYVIRELKNGKKQTEIKDELGIKKNTLSEKITNIVEKVSEYCLSNIKDA